MAPRRRQGKSGEGGLSIGSGGYSASHLYVANTATHILTILPARPSLSLEELVAPDPYYPHLPSLPSLLSDIFFTFTMAENNDAQVGLFLSKPRFYALVRRCTCW